MRKSIKTFKTLIIAHPWSSMSPALGMYPKAQIFSYKNIHCSIVYDDVYIYLNMIHIP